jgi:hypothetical protein
VTYDGKPIIFSDTDFDKLACNNFDPTNIRKCVFWNIDVTSSNDVRNNNQWEYQVEGDAASYEIKTHYTHVPGTWAKTLTTYYQRISHNYATFQDSSYSYKPAEQYRITQDSANLYWIDTSRVYAMEFTFKQYVQELQRITNTQGDIECSLTSWTDEYGIVQTIANWNQVQLWESVDLGDHDQAPGVAGVKPDSFERLRNNSTEWFMDIFVKTVFDDDFDKKYRIEYPEYEDGDVLANKGHLYTTVDNNKHVKHCKNRNGHAIHTSQQVVQNISYYQRTEWITTYTSTQIWWEWVLNDDNLLGEGMCERLDVMLSCWLKTTEKICPEYLKDLKKMLCMSYCRDFDGFRLVEATKDAVTGCFGFDYEFCTDHCVGHVPHIKEEPCEESSSTIYGVITIGLSLMISMMLI